jgi:hypothetical protein
VRPLVLVAALAALALPALAADAGPLAFSTEPGPALNIARALLGEEREEALRDDEIVSVAVVDLDEDGTSEIFAFADASYFCGSAGCVPRLYQLDRSTAKWRELPFATDAMLNSEPAHWSIAPAKAGTWSVLEMKTEVLRLYFAWNGEAFVRVDRE